MKKSYADQLKDPRWQKKRLEVLGQAKWTCQECLEITKELHVHHMYYERGLKPWEYPKSAYMVLCVDCHSEIQELQYFLARSIAQQCSEGIASDVLRSMAYFARFLPFPSPDEEEVACLMSCGKAIRLLYLEKIKQATSNFGDKVNE